MGNNLISIDVIIPSYRLQSEYLISIVQMEAPPDTKVRYLIIADNPDLETPEDLKPFIDDENVFLFRNKVNSGASESRNVGLDNSKGDWILFIDDDVKPHKELLKNYVQAIMESSNDVGFFGETLFPEPTRFFTKGIIASDILTFFFIAGYYDQLKWAPTSNVIIKRSAIGNIRFQEKFPKNGGGEDIDFFLKIYGSTNKELQCLKNAPVFHNWWYDQRRVYKRFVRWSYGDSLLHEIYPQYTYYNFPNIIETIFFGLPISIFVSFYTFSILPMICLIAGVLIGEVLIELIRLIIYKNIAQTKYALEVALIRASNDIGRLKMQVFKLKRLKGVFERFDHFCDGKHVSFQRIWAGIKFFSYIVIMIGLYFFYIEWLQ